MRFNQYINSHFRAGGCRLIARAHDDVRGRAVEIYAMPGYHEDVGITDGTDAWVAPAMVAPFMRTSSCDLREQLRRLRDGEPLLPVPDPSAPRRRVRLDPETSSQPAAPAAQLPRRERVRL